MPDCEYQLEQIDELFRSASMKTVAAALVNAQRSHNLQSESALIKKIADTYQPLPKVNATTAMPMPQRFMSKLVFGANTCWIWRGCVDEIGYGRFPYKGENKAHRVAHKLFIGPIPSGQLVLHKCDNRQCVNPDHLFTGTQFENMRDMVRKGRGKQPLLNGSLNPMAKLTEQAVTAIRLMLANGAKQIEASKTFGVSPMTISRIARNEAWK